MNLKQYITITILCLSGFMLSNCSDDNNLVGSGTLPDGDFITVFTDTFQITASTVKKDSLYAKTTKGLLGEFYDPLYGYLKSDFLSQFYCKEGFKFSQTPYENKIDSISLHIYYRYTGDPQATMQIQVYPVNKPLDKIFYTDINPADYCDMQNPLGAAVYSPASGIPQDTTTNTYLLEIRLPVELGQKFYDETINNPSSFASQTAFNQFFPGVYVTTDYGNGCMLELLEDNHTSISIAYNYALTDTAGKDSLVTTYEHFIATKEVIQLNRMESYGDDQLLVENDDYTYLKTPAGIFTRLVIPAKEIGSIVKDRILNSLNFNLKYMPREEWTYALNPPPQLLLLPEDSLSNFFKTNNKENGINTFLSHSGGGYSSYTTPLGYSATNRTYYFGNIINLINYHLTKNPEEDLKLLVVPISRDYTNIGGSYSGAYYQTISLSHYLAPSGVKLRKDVENMKIILTSSQYINK